MSGVERGELFDSVAEQYERARPSYPAALVNEVIARSGLPAAGRILEIGSGTGKASVLFAARGHRMVCLEPGPRLAAVAASKLAGDPRVSIELVRFEDWDDPDSVFDLVFAAQAFHWIDPEIRVAKAARCLRPGGWLALFWNTPEPSSEPVDWAILQTYVRNAPSLLSGASAITARPTPAPQDEIDASGLFGPVVSRSFSWSASYPSREYVELVQTQSDHLALPEAERNALRDALHETILSNGGVCRVRYSTRLFMAQRRAL